jgi:hypothetical protein
VVVISVVCLFLEGTKAGDYERVAQSLKNFASNNGRPPNDNDFFAIVLRPGNAFSYEELDALYKEVLQQNNSNISKTDLLAIVASKRGAISDVRIKYKSDISYADGRPTISFMSEYASTKNSFFSDQIIFENNMPRSRRIVSYDGEHFYRYTPLLRNGSSLDTVSIPLVGMDRDFDISLFFDPFNPLSFAMLTDTELYGRKFYFICDLQLLLLGDNNTVVFETKEVHDGIECVVVGNWYTRVLLSPQHDYSPLLAEAYYLTSSSGESPKEVFPVSRSIAERRTLLDVKHYGNAIWLPSKATVEFFDKEKNNTSVVNVNVELLEVNKGLSESFFVDFIPENALISDTSRGLIYEWSDSPSIDSLLKSVVQSKRVWTFQIISLTLGILLILTWIIIQYRTHLNMKNAG